MGRLGASAHGVAGPDGTLRSDLDGIPVHRWPWPDPLPRLRTRPVAASEAPDAVPADRVALADRRRSVAGPDPLDRARAAAGLGSARLRSSTRRSLHRLLDEDPGPTRTTVRRLLHEAGRLDALDLGWGRRLEALVTGSGSDADVLWVVGDEPLGAALTLPPRAGRRVVYDVRADLAGQEAGPGRRLRMPAAGARARRERRLAARADVVVVGSPEGRVAAGSRLAPSRLELVPDHLAERPSDRPVAPALTDLAERVTGPHRVVVVADPVVGRAANDLEHLLPVVAEHPDLHLVVVSGGRAHGRRGLRTAATQAGVREQVHWVDEAPDGWLGTSLHAAVVGVVLAADAAEAQAVLPASYLRLRADGVPVVAQATAPLALAVGTDAGAVLVEQADGKGLAAAVRRALRHHDHLAARPADPDLSRSARARLREVLGPVAGAVPGAAPARPAAIAHETRLSAVPRTLGVGPANFAGQGWAWAKAAERALPGLRTEVFARHQGTLTFRADRVLPADRFSTLAGRLDEARHLGEGLTHLLAEANRPLLGGLVGDDASGDLALLRRSGVRVAVALHGSEARHPARHAELERWSPFRHDSPEARAYREWAEGLVERTTAMLEGFDGQVFVSTPDLLLDVPRARWLPVVVDVDLPAGAAPLTRDGLPVVVHAPSKAVAKGTSLVEPLLHALDDEGVLTYRPVSGVAPSEMPALLAGADVVLDQFALGSYGVLACEAMAAGRVVVGNVNPVVRDLVGEDLPIVQATPDDLEDVLRALLADPDGARATAARGREFVRRVHGGSRSGELLRDAFLLADPT